SHAHAQAPACHRRAAAPALAQVRPPVLSRALTTPPTTALDSRLEIEESSAMRKHLLFVSAVIFLLASGPPAPPQKTKFYLDAGGGKNLVSFVSDDPIEQFVGRTAQTTGTLEIDLANVETATGEATVDMTTLDTGIDGRNRHMQSTDFLDTAQFPKATLAIKKIKTAGDKGLAHGKPVVVDVTGDLTIKGATR